MIVRFPIFGSKRTSYVASRCRLQEIESPNIDRRQYSFLGKFGEFAARERPFTTGCKGSTASIGPEPGYLGYLQNFRVRR